MIGSSLHVLRHLQNVNWTVITGTEELLCDVSHWLLRGLGPERRNPLNSEFNPICHLLALLGKSVPLQARRGPEGSGKLSFPDFVTSAQDGVRLSALRTGRFYPQEILLVLISVRG